jgi:hypothetical protein
MKNLLKKPWFTGILIMATVLIIFSINFWIMSLPLTWLYNYDNLLQIPIDQLEGGARYIFGYILMLVFYISSIPILLSVISLFRKKHGGFIIAGLVFLGFDTALIAFQSITDYLPLLATILMIVNIVLALFLLTLVIIRTKTMDNEETLSNEEELVTKKSKVPLLVLLVDILAVAVFITTFIVPLYTRITDGVEYTAVIINLLFAKDTSDIVMISFFIDFVIFLCIFLYFAEALSNYIFNKEKFMRQSKRLITFSLVATSLFFLAGLIIEIYYTVRWDLVITTISYIPMLVMLGVVILYSILIGMFKDFKDPVTGEKKQKYHSVEPLVYLILLSAVAVLMLFLPIVKIDITSGGYTYYINLTGLSILYNYGSLDIGYRIIAYLLFVMLISVGFSLVIAITSYLSKSKLFTSVLKFSTIVNIFFIFIIAISGYFFQIAREINKAIILDIADFYGFNIPNSSTLDYLIGTDTIYALIAALFVLIIMFVRKSFDRDDNQLLETDLLQLDPSLSTEEVEEEVQNFDPCYSFTELDSKIELFNEELIKREALRIIEPTLDGLINFIVEYARNSRLHLSYTQEDIATFVAGLGASKLSVLQGMSGTGKTSLPKIFSEAIYGNCDIIEVESSWKDKNELLGYYNEFSMQYTPKKFTLALYKAALNKDVFTFILLDEMNLSRIEYYFSDFLSLMEHEEDQREIKLINIKLTRKENNEEIEYLALENGHTLAVPPNVWFIGTANRDESTFVISDKVYDRAHTMNFTKRAPKVRNYSDPISKQYYDYQTMNQLFENAKANGDFDAENSNLIKSIEILLSPYNISFGNRILKQIEDFVNIYKECFKGEDVESEAIEKILLSKVVSKLEVKTIEDKEKLEMEFARLNLIQCAEFIKHLDDD